MARYDFCPHCGTANNGGDFCANCGAPLTAPDAGSLQDMQTVPIPVLTTPQGYLDQDGRPIDLSQMAQDFPPDEPHRRGISKKTITVIAALVVVLIVVSAVCGWMIWSNRQRGSQLAACQSAVSSVKASESKAKSEYETAKKLSKTSEEKLDDASLLADLANALGSQKPIAADDYVCDASDGTARLRVVGEQARKDLTSQKAWLRSVNKASKLVQASIDKQTAKDKADKAAKAKAAKESEEKTKKQSQNSTIETSELIWPDFCSALIVGRFAPLGLHNTLFRSVPVSCSPRTGADASSPRHETHRNVANSRSLKSWKGLRRQTSSVLYAPSALSAMTLSYESPTVPVEGSMPNSPTLVVYTRLMHCAPWSEWCTRPSVPPCEAAHDIACSSACSGGSPVSMVVAHAHPTILRANTSAANVVWPNGPLAMRT